MAKLSAYDSDVLSEVQNYNTYQDNNVNDQSVQEMQYSKQPVFVGDSNIDITSDSNFISYDHYLQQNENVVVQDTTSFAQKDAMIMFVIEEMSHQVAKCQLVQRMHMLTKPQVFYDENHKTAPGYQNPLHLTQGQRKQHAMYCGHTLVKKPDPLSVIDSKEILELAKATRLKINEKQNDSVVKEKRVNIKPIDYGSLNELYKHFVPQKQLFAKQSFWLPISKTVSEQTPVQPKPVQNDLPR
ncbi:hypothetical protein Tco_1252679 [Tanacetum coccineum]